MLRLQEGFAASATTECWSASTDQRPLESVPVAISPYRHSPIASRDGEIAAPCYQVQRYQSLHTQC